MPTAEVNGARLWYDEAGDGETVLLLHGGLGDSGLWEPVVALLAHRFRTIRTDLRFSARTEEKQRRIHSQRGDDG